MKKIYYSAFALMFTFFGTLMILETKNYLFPNQALASNSVDCRLDADGTYLQPKILPRIKAAQMAAIAEQKLNQSLNKNYNSYRLIQILVQAEKYPEYIPDKKPKK